MATTMLEEDNSEFLCIDCGMDTCEFDEFYMVNKQVWRTAIPAAPHKGMLCIGCLEKRLGRELDHDDFRWCALNLRNLITGSERLRSRMDADGVLLTGLANLDMGEVSMAIAKATTALLDYEEELQGLEQQGVPRA